MKIAQSVTTLDARAGGPSISVPKLAQALAQIGNEVDLLATSANSKITLRVESLTTRTFRSSWPHSLGASPGLSSHLKVTSYDLIHHHGLWQRPLNYAHLFAKTNKVPFVISPRGMLSPWAWRHNQWKKKFAMKCIHPNAFSCASAWHATSYEEANDIKALGFTQPICVAPNGVDIPSESQIAAERAYWTEACPETASRPTALFYSRFHRKKRVLELIDIWVQHAPKDWLLLMVGIPQEYTVAQLRDYVLRSSGSGRILVFDGTEVPPPYAVSSLFLLPSHSENFGMVIAEALIHGLPVLVTDTTPWKSINETDFGWCGPWELFTDALSASLAMGPEILRQRGVQAKEWVAAEYSWSNCADRLIHFYKSLTDK